MTFLTDRKTSKTIQTNANLARSRGNAVHYRAQTQAYARMPQKVKEACDTTEKRQRIVLKRLVEGKHYLPLPEES